MSWSTPSRTIYAEALLERGCTISVQGINKFANVARRKLGKSWQEIRTDVAAIRVLCPVIVPIDLDSHDAALRLAERHAFTMFDALMVAAALQAGSSTPSRLKRRRPMMSSPAHCGHLLQRESNAQSVKAVRYAVRRALFWIPARSGEMGYFYGERAQ
jgi:hypothetical protein